MRVRFLALALIIFGVMYLGYQQITAQNLVTCPGLVQQAIDSVGNNCGGLQRNSACYGYNDVQATFSQPQPNGFFTVPSDRAKLLDLEDLITSPMNQTDNRWGIALLSAQANLPDTLPGQSVIFMLLGDTQVENAVQPDQAFQTGAIVSVTMQIGAQLYFSPNFNDLVVGSIPTGTKVTADAVSADGQWVRIAYGGKPGWVTKQVIATDGDLTKLPVIGPDTKTPMQAFYFRTSISGTDCTEAPNALVIQGPKNVTVNVNANGADIRLGSTIALYLLPVDDAAQNYISQHYGKIGPVSQLMQIIVLDGHVVLNAGKPNEVDLKTGETSFICLSDPQNLGIDGLPNDRQTVDGCPWAPGRTVTLADIEKFTELEGFTLNYPIELPFDVLTPTPTNTSTLTYTPTQTDTPSKTPTPTPTVTPTLTYTPTNTYTLRPGQKPNTPTPTRTITNTPTVTNTPTDTDTPTVTPTDTDTDTPTATGTDTDTPTVTPTDTDTDTPTATSTSTDTPTATATDTPSCAAYDFSATVSDTTTLIAAINAANDESCNPGSNTINLASGGTFTFGGVVDGSNTMPQITSAIIIEGNGSTITSSMEGFRRYFQIVSDGNLTLKNLTITGGYMVGSDGGAILNNGSLTLSGLFFQSNTGLNGGAINNSGSLTASNTTFDTNSASTNGGALYNTGSATLQNTTFMTNSAQGGGAIDNEGGSVTLVNNTLASNSIVSGGGSALLNGSGGSIINFTTIYQNSSEGGAAVNVNGGSVTFKNSIVAANSGGNCGSSVSTQGVNFADDGSCSGFTQSSMLDLMGVNGSNPAYVPFDATSEAVDAAPDCTTTTGSTVSSDIVGTGRPVDGNGDTSAQCDPGSYELPPIG